MIIHIVNIIIFSQIILIIGALNLPKFNSRYLKRQRERERERRWGELKGAEG